MVWGALSVNCPRRIATASSSFDSGTVASFLTLLRSRHLYHRALNDNGELAGGVIRRTAPTCPASLPRHDRGYFAPVWRRRRITRWRVPLETDDAVDELARRTNEPRGDLADMPDGRDYVADAVTWKTLGDFLRGKLVAIGQATISERKWTRKQPSQKWASGRLVRFLTQPTNIVAFVESISLTTNEVIDGLARESAPLPLDRFRICSFCGIATFPTRFRRE